MNLVIVESPAKAKTIGSYLGKNFQVLASYGHVRDLPPKDGSVRPDEDFAMSWEVSKDSVRQMKAISDAMKSADKLILATDPDREGEAISWHIFDVLQKKGALKGKSVERVAFNQITKKAVQEAISAPREIDTELVDAYLARRSLDYLVGFTLSPVLWRKLPGARSAGRVQSVALRLVVEREMEIEQFRAEEYWKLEALMKSAAGETFTARLSELNGAKADKFTLRDEKTATAAEAAVRAASFYIADVEAKPGKRNPPPPFTTSTLQQEAARKLGFSASRTMQVAQKLYEGVNIGGETVGLITYMRTDGVSMAGEAIANARDVIGKRYGARYVPSSPRQYKSKQKNAQEAHEAVRPTSFSYHPDDLRLDPDQKRLYTLIWQRAIASQMESADVERTTINIAAKDGSVGLRATGTVILFDGFLTLYEEGKDDPVDEEGARLPNVSANESVNAEKVSVSQHFTEPPPRYSEASLVKKMEELGIGRPSTYASVLSVLRDRSYVRMDKNRFIPEDKGRLVVHFLENFFARYVEYDFTADLEEKLDLISDGKLNWKEVLRDFWQHFSANVEDVTKLRITDVLEALNKALAHYIFPEKEEGGDPRACPSCSDGRLSLKAGKFGAFIGCSNYPDCQYTRQFSTQAEAQAAEDSGPKVLGQDENGVEVSLRTGRFGPYVQLGDEAKPPRSSIPKGVDPNEVTLEYAIKLLSLPRDVGPHPETGEMITAGLGRFGPFVKHKSTYANLSGIEEVFSVGINRAVSLIAEKEAGKGGRNGGASTLKELGEHPDGGGAITVKSGRYGPYVNHGKINATLPKGKEPEALTLEEALELIAAKAGASPAKKKAAAKKPAAKKPAAKKAATKAKAKA